MPTLQQGADVISLHPERYLGRAEIAEAMGVSERTIDRWCLEGAPFQTWGLRTKKFRMSEMVGWAETRHRAKAS